ncbi:MAG: LicD family protein [Clostridia bacterium]|nr:LicD family protein [Clostridia bacterium]
MTALQEKMLELVLEIDSICREHDIVYYLAGGSVLGAVRHRGYIPWDDDIDIMMTRQSFARFQEVCKTCLPPNREIITQINTPCHTKVTIKYMDKTTSQFFRSQVLDTTGCGISLDIFILDPLPRDPATKERHIAEYVVYNELLTPFFMVNDNLYKYVDLYNEYRDRMATQGREAVMDELYRHLFVDEPAESDLYLYRWGQQHLIYDKTLFGNPRYLEFEGHSLPVPERTVDFLRATYGDTWLYLPEMRQRETHVSDFSTTVAYRNWLSDIRPAINSEKALERFVERKKLNVAKARPAHDMLVNGLKQNALLVEMELEDPDFAPDVLTSLEDEALLTRVRNYLTLQLKSPCVKNKILVGISPQALEPILMALIRRGDFHKADKILKLWEENHPDFLPRVRNIIDRVRKLVRLFEDRWADGAETPPSVEEAAEVVALFEELPGSVNAARCRLLLALENGEGETLAEEILRIHPDDREVAYYAGVLFQKAGKRERAWELYEKAVGTDNGRVRMALIDMNVKGAENLD